MPYTQEDVMQALRNADAAGNKEDAQKLAGMLRDMMAQEAPAEIPAAPAPKPETGFWANVKGSAERIKGDVGAVGAAMGVSGAEQYAAEKRKKADEMATIAPLTESPWEAIKGMAGASLPYMAAPVAAAFAAPEAVVAGGALTAAEVFGGGASAAQFFGSNLSRQLQEGKTGENLNVAGAAAAAPFQAALDVFGMRMIPGIRGILGKAGVDVTAKEAEQIAKQGVLQAYGTGAIKTAGAEGMTEAAQQVLERLQAGLKITDPEARKEYFDSFVGGAVLGGALHMPGTALERMGSKEPAPAVAPEVAPETVPAAAPEAVAEPALAGVATAVTPEERPRGFVEKMRPPVVREPEAAAATPEPTPQAMLPNVQQLMDQLLAGRPELDTIKEQAREAAAKGDTAAINAIAEQHQAAKTKLEELEASIKGLGGVTETPETFEATATSALNALDTKIKNAQKKLADAGELGEIETLPKLAAKLDALKEERKTLGMEYDRQREVLKVNAIPVGKNIPLIEEETQPPISSVKPEEAGAGPLPKVSEKEPVFPSGTMKLKDKTKLTYPSARLAEPFDMFSDFNVLNTALNNRDPKVLATMQRAQENADRKAAAALVSKQTPRESVYEAMKDRIDGIVRRERNYDTYEYTDQEGVKREVYVTDEAAKQIKALRDKVEKPVTDKNGVVKRSMLQIAHDRFADYEKQRQLMDAATDPARKAVLKNKVEKAKAEYEKVLARIAPERAKLDAAMAKMFKTTILQTPGQKEAELQALGKSKRSVSRTAKTAARINAGDVRKEAEASAQMKELASDIGADTDEYKKAYAANAKKYQALKEKLGAEDKRVVAFLDKTRTDMEELAIKLGKTSPEYKAVLKEQVEQYAASMASAGKQAQKSVRTPQTTRKVAKLGAMPTGTAESKERTAKANERMTRDFAQAKASEEGKFARGVEVESKDLTSTQIQHLENDDIEMALYDISKDSSNDPLNRAVAEQLYEVLDNTKVELHNKLTDSEGKEVLGEAVSTLVKLSRAGGLSQEVLLHEGTHAAVERVIQVYLKTPNELTKEQLVACKELQALFEAAKRDPSITSVNAKGSLSEFAAEVMSNSNLQAQLKKKKWKLSNAWIGFVSAVLRAIGVKNVENMLEASIQSVEALMIPSSIQPKKVATEERPRYARNDDSVGVRTKEDGSHEFRAQTQPVAVAQSFVAKDASFKDKLIGNVTGLAGRVQFVDQYAALSAAFKKGVDANVVSDLEAQQAEFYLRFGQQSSQYATQALTNGPLELRKGEGGGHIYASKPGANMIKVAEAVSRANVGNDTQTEAMLTAYLAGKRAEVVGWDKLNFTNPALAQREYNDVMRILNADDKAMAAFKEAADIYQQYNNGQLDFLVQTGYLTAKAAAEMKKIPYIPFYRTNRNGDIELVIDKAHIVKLSNIKDEPQLQQLIGDNTQIQPVFTSAVQNTFLLTNIALRNQSVKDSAFLLKRMGIASTLGEGYGPAGSDTIRFKVKGVDYFAKIDTDMYGIPAKLIVTGMEGIKTTLPAVFKLMGMPADVLRKFVTRAPTYALKQAFRDPLTAWMTTGTDGVPVLNSFKELASMVAGRSEVEAKLMASGAISSNVFTGDQRDMQKALRELSTGKKGWSKLLAKLDAFAMQGDAATRAVVYKDSLNKGMSEMQALLRTLESMNFGRRGVDPSIQALSTIIPFFNAQIQGLDVLYRAFKGDMPYSEQLKIRQKLVARGLMLAAGTIAYAALMQDDEAYKRAKPEERYGNWFVHIPGTEEPLKIPIPFELGILFKALPEAVFNAAATDEKASNAAAGIGKLAALSNPFALPQAIKPLTEVVLGKSFFSGDIESQREKGMLPEERYRDTTTELSKLIGSATGKAGIASPIQLDYLIRGYTGGLGIALVQLANPLLNSEAKANVETPTTKTSKMPFIGGMFQPVEGRGTLDEAYDRMQEIQQTKGTFNRLVEEGRLPEAQAFARDHIERLAAASVSGSVQQHLGQYAKMRRQITSSPNLTTERKDELLKNLDKQQTKYASTFLEVTDRTIPR